MIRPRLVVILGASYAKGWNPEGTAGLRFINKGIGGEQSWQLLERFERDVIGERPDAVLIWGLINDIFRTRRSDVRAALELAMASNVEMVALARRACIEPVLATEVTIRGKKSSRDAIVRAAGRLLGRRSYQDYVNAQVLEMNNRLRRFAADQHVMLLDLQPVLSDRRGDRRRLYAQEDGSHLSDAGYAALSDYAVPLLDAGLPKR